MQNIVENNRLIAEFLGLIESAIQNNYWTNKSKEGFGVGELTELKYHSDWNWLMELIQKIEENYIVDIMGSAISIHDQKSGEMIVDNSADIQKGKIQCIYIGVVEFIKWYNQQKAN